MIYKIAKRDTTLRFSYHMNKKMKKNQIRLTEEIENEKMKSGKKEERCLP